MLNYSDFTIINNEKGLPTALGFPINSLLLKTNTPLMMSGGGGKRKNNVLDYLGADNNQLAIPAGLVCRTITVCSEPVIMEEENEVVPEGLYEKLLALAEQKPPGAKEKQPGAKEKQPAAKDKQPGAKEKQPAKKMSKRQMKEKVNNKTRKKK